MAGDNSRPLSGIRVLELGNFIAAPFAARVFADFGADVIKIEYPGRGDELRRWRLPRGETSMLFRTIARGKRSVTLDLRSSQGQQIALDLVRKCDVVVENFRPGVLERWGLGPEQLTDVNPELVIVRISGYGQTGPYSSRAGFGGVAEAFAGLRHITGYPELPPVRSAAAIGDTVAGLYGVIGALMLLLRRARNEGSSKQPVVDVALYEAVYSILDSLVPDYDAYGVVRERTAGSLPGVVPSGSYPTNDGQAVMIAGNADAVFVRLMTAIGRPDLAEQAVDGAERTRRQEELDATIANWTAQRTVDEALTIMESAGVPAGPVYDAAGISKDPHYEARGMLQPYDVVVDTSPETVRFPGVVPQLSSTPARAQWVGPDLGQHTDEVLTELLGLLSDDIGKLRAEGVV